MNWITAPSRAFGVGETKSQNAVIKVYSAAELRSALTKIYTSSIGIGTIQIAGDIVITTPIKLVQTLPPDISPIEIIIESVGGAKIINGRPLTSDYTATDNIIFDMGEANSSLFNICKYTFRNLRVNSVSALAFRAICQWSAALGSVCGPIFIDSMIATNLTNIFDARNGNIELYQCVVNNFVYDTTVTTYYNCNINSTNVRISAGNFSNFALSNLNLSSCSVTFNENSSCNSNIFTNIFIPFSIVSTDSTHGTGVITGTGLYGISYPKVAGWQVNNDAVNSYTQFSGKVDVVGDDQGSGKSTVQHFQLYNTSVLAGFAGNIFTPILPANGRYLIEWTFTIKIGTLVNSYIMQTGIKISAGNVITILSNSTIYAVEEYFTVTGLIPAVAGTRVFIAPGDVTNAITVDGSMKITGYTQIF